MPRGRNWRAADERIRKKNARRAKMPAELLAEELRLEQEQIDLRKAEASRRNGQLGGRPIGSSDGFPIRSVEALESLNYKVKKDEPPEAAALAGFALRKLAQVAAGRVSRFKAGSMLKACLALREEICEPIVKEAHFTGGVSLVSALASVAATIEEKQPGALPSMQRPEGSDPEVEAQENGEPAADG